MAVDRRFDARTGFRLQPAHRDLPSLRQWSANAAAAKTTRERLLTHLKVGRLERFQIDLTDLVDVVRPLDDRLGESAGGGGGGVSNPEFLSRTKRTYRCSELRSQAAT